MLVNAISIPIHNLKGNTIFDLFHFLEVSNTRIAVEYNGKIITSQEYDQIILKEDDILEIIHFVGGG